MRKLFNVFVLGLLLGGALGWFASGRWHAPTTSADDQRFKQEVTRAVDAAGESLYRAGEAVQAKLEALELKPDEIKEELARTGKVVRRRAREVTGQAAEAAVDAKTTAVIKAKLAADRDLSVWSISVSTSAGRVVLDGTLASEDQIGKAILLAMETDGVMDVTANLRVKPKE